MNEFFTSASQEYRLHTVMPDDVAITFELDGTDGGIWTLSRVGEHVRVDSFANQWSDCHLRCTVPDFRALVAGELEGKAAFMDGRLRIRGDVGLILRLLEAVVN